MDRGLINNIFTAPRSPTPGPRYGLVAGNGRFPFLVLDAARSQGLDLVVAAIKEETFPEIEQHTSHIEWMGLGQLGRLIKYFKREGVTHAMMAGQVKHAQIFSGTIPDWRMVKVLASLMRKNTNSLIGAVVRELEGEGIAFIDSTAFLEPLLAPEGILTRRSPNQTEELDIEYGIEVASTIAGLDLGQTIAVKDQAVVAVEAMEGTDATIQRAGQILQRQAFSAIKVAKPNQDMRFDVPVIGVPTIESMVAAGAKSLSITARKTLIFDKEQMVDLADKNDITIIGSAH